MPSLLISPEAEQDLLDIWLYIAEDSLVNADRFLDKLKTTALKVTEFTEIGVDRSELAFDLKSFPVGRYILYYRKYNEGVELVRVLHSSRDIDLVF